MMKINLRRLSLSILFVCLSVLIININNLAQTLDTVTFTGRVADTNNAPVVGATVTVTQTERNIERTVTTDEDGRYRVVELPPGVYKLIATQQGFATQEKIDLTTIAGQNVQLDFNLAPAGVSAEQIVTLEGDDAPVVDTTRTVVGGTVTQREIEELPIL
jgi:hypothetical protein